MSEEKTNPKRPGSPQPQINERKWEPDEGQPAPGEEVAGLQWEDDRSSSLSWEFEQVVEEEEAVKTQGSTKETLR